MERSEVGEAEQGRVRAVYNAHSTMWALYREGEETDRRVSSL
jgi:hypothetical protein